MSITHNEINFDKEVKRIIIQFNGVSIYLVLPAQQQNLQQPLVNNTQSYPAQQQAAYPPGEVFK